MTENINPLTHRSIVVTLPASMVASSLSSAIILAQTGGAPLRTVVIIGVENLAVFVGLAVGIWFWNRRLLRKAHVGANKPYEKTPAPAKALIAMVSAGGGRATALAAADYHIKELEHVWLLTTPTAEPDAIWVSQQIAAVKPDIAIHPIAKVEDNHTIDEVKQLVESLRRKAIADCGIAEGDLICDFTGLTKHASAGMVLACAPREARLEYVAPATKDPSGRGLTPGKPIEVELAYLLTPDTSL
jgi:hypothetical protein